jgi:CheY-like chemotaxis protein
LQIQQTLLGVPASPILIIEDSSNDAELAKKQLEAYGLGVVAVPNCEAGSRELETQKFSMVFLDWKLTGISGLDALKKLKSIPACPIVIVLTGVATDNDAAMALAHGAAAVMAKPLTDENVQLIFGSPH